MWIDRKNIFNQHHAQVPIVDVIGDVWRIYYSTRFNGKSQPMWVEVDGNNPTKILNQSTSPILELGKAGSFDVAGVMPTDIIDINGLKYMYYIGWTERIDVPYHNTIGLAISDDGGNNWKKFSDGPVFGTSNIETGYTGTIDIIQKDDIFYGYYLSCREWKEFDGKLEPIYDIKWATSKNGINWNPQNISAVSLKDGEGGISKASVLKKNDMYYMWYSRRMESDYRDNPNRSYRIKCSVSYDLINWKESELFGLDIDTNSDWDNIMVEYPEVFEHNDNIHMLYNGNKFGQTGIGYARLKK
jgi:predicted GH43/DUF377 family glycosyl hydrolase